MLLKVKNGTAAEARDRYAVSTGTATTWDRIGVTRYLGSTITAFPPADCSFERDIVKCVVQEDPRLRPLWSTKAWKLNTGGVEKRTYLLLAFEGSQWNLDHPPLERVILPTHTTTVPYRGPFRCPSTLDGLEQMAAAKGIPDESVGSTADRWRAEGAIGQYIPLAAVYPEIRYRAWEVRHKRQYGDNWKLASEESQDYYRHLDEQEHVATQKIKDRILENRADDRKQLQRERGTGDSVYVSSTLRKMREAAGMEMVA